MPLACAQVGRRLLALVALDMTRAVRSPAPHLRVKLGLGDVDDAHHPEVLVVEDVAVVEGAACEVAERHA